MFAEAEPTVLIPDPGVEVRTLRPEDVGALRLGLHHRVGAREVRETLRRLPGRSVWSPDSREFALLAPWRHRSEIAVVQVLAAVRSAEWLLAGVVERCRAAGDALVLLIELDEVRHPRFYRRAGFDPLEDVVTLELARPSPALPSEDEVAFLRFDPANEAMLASLVAVDHAAFPWLWRNSELEFRTYAMTPGVEVYLGLRAGEPVAYLGFTVYAGWGHLDRIAVVPTRQGMGLGGSALRFAVGTLARRGARRVALSTQADNLRSRRLYGARLAGPALQLGPGSAALATGSDIISAIGEQA